ncbi:hypothetical protein ANANG_G00200790 [Anguilla anguilla]|uniref:Uncharacterized protein n=1 Tax=Anguilla anguilla TaxID=7936 RepID=A0A9D3LZM4_ANGAN|nr:hypothetical protein ANANG_G00200790 [Anguilla anguilla]
MLSAGRQLVELSGETLALRNLFLILLFIAQTPAWPHDYRLWNANCPGAEWNIMCRGCCEYDQIRCKCPAQGTLVGYSVPCCRNAINECDPCIIHPARLSLSQFPGKKEPVQGGGLLPVRLAVPTEDHSKVFVLGRTTLGSFGDWGRSFAQTL